MSIFEIFSCYLKETSTPGDYVDLKEKKKGITNGQRLKEKLLESLQCLVHVKRSITLKEFILHKILIRFDKALKLMLKKYFLIEIKIIVK